MLGASQPTIQHQSCTTDTAAARFLAPAPTCIAARQCADPLCANAAPPIHLSEAASRISRATPCSTEQQTTCQAAVRLQRGLSDRHRIVAVRVSAHSLCVSPTANRSLVNLQHQQASSSDTHRVQQRCYRCSATARDMQQQHPVMVKVRPLLRVAIDCGN